MENGMREKWYGMFLPYLKQFCFRAILSKDYDDWVFHFYRPQKYLSLQIIMNGIVTQLKQLFSSEYRNLSGFIYWGISHVFLRTMEVFMEKDTFGVCVCGVCVWFSIKGLTHKGQFLLIYMHVCSWGTRGMSSEMVCHSLLQWATFCQNSPPSPIRLGWPYMT